MSQKLKNEIGNRYGLLTVKALTKDKNGRTAWLCECDCGNTKIVRGPDLRTGKITSCGKHCKLRHVRNAQFKDETGNRYGLLTVLYRNGKNSSGKTFWHCKCDCGKELDVIGEDLRNGKTKSCGCLSKTVASERNFKDETGNKYGKLTVIELVSNHPKAMWKCQCECGNVVIVKGIDLRSGNTKSCGCLLSYQEERIEKLLKDLGVHYSRQYTFKDLVSEKGNKLRFDFAIFSTDGSIKCLIEYNGMQHYIPVEFYGGEEGLEEQKKRDNKKIEYCKQHGIPLIILDKNDNIEETLIAYIYKRGDE